MKKVILSVLVVGSLMATSCKKAKEASKEAQEKTEQTVDQKVEETKKEVTKAVETVESAIEGVTIPKFDDEKVNAYVKEYSDYAKKYIDAGGDVLKNADLAKTGVALASKGTELVKTMDEETKKKFNGVMNAIKAKMAPSK